MMNAVLTLDVRNLIEVLNEKSVNEGLERIYVGRKGYGRSASALANPFKMKNGSNSERERVVEAYRHWLKKHVILPGLNGTKFENFVTEDTYITAETNQAAWKQLLMLARWTKRGNRRILLSCWCVDPNKGIDETGCHAGVIKEAMIWLATSEDPRVKAVVESKVRPIK